MMINEKITFKLIGGESGEDLDSYNPLARALTNLLQTGQPFQRLTQCFVLDDRGQASQNKSRLRWLGVFVHSAGNRVIFFPGFADPMTQARMRRQTEPEVRQAFQFDHFTLESDLQRWHITSLDSSEHIPGSRTLFLGGERYLWFGFCISSLDVLRIAKETTVVTAPVPISDAERRMRVVLDAREDAEFPLLGFHPNIARSDISTAHFSIIVGKGGSKLYKGNRLGLPYDSPYLTEPLENQELLYPTKRHQIELSPDRDLQIVTSILPSRLIDLVVVTSPSE